jgi:hypothetical protein
MKQTRNKWRLAGLLLFAVTAGIQAQWKYVPEGKEIPAHPRILLLEGEERQIKDNVASDPVWAKVHQAIMDECDKMVALPELERIQTGRRLLSVSREAIRRIFYLSYAFRMSGQDKYLKKAEKEMLAISAFSDWNPSHFLDVAEMTMALSIGYDWLYPSLAAPSRDRIKNAILKKGIDPSLNSKQAWYLTATHNWNQVCNAGITYGALAVYEEMPELAKALIDKAVETIQLPMNDYAPDGAYPEGYGYWEYGTSFNVLFLSAIEKVFQTDFGLNAWPGFLKTAAYQEQATGPSNVCYNYADCGLGGGLSPAMFWFAAKRNDPSLLWNEKTYLAKDIRTGDRILPAIMIWGRGMKMSDVQPPRELLWTGQGITPVAFMRTSWTDPGAIYVGFKGGTASSNHAHMDAGSFIMEADGVRWASDFGMQDYNSLETKGVDLWNRAQDSQRWQVFRYNNYAHNTLTVDNQLHRVEGYADIRSSSSSPSFMSVTSDLSGIFKGQLSECVRGVAIVDRQYVAVRDEVKTGDKETTLRWTMLTTAGVKITGGNSIELRKDGKKLKLEVAEPAKVTMKTWTTVSANDFDAPNPGTTLVGFEVKIPANTAAALSVKLIPQSAKTTSTAPALDQWTESALVRRAKPSPATHSHSDMELLRKKFIAELLAPPVQDAQVKELIATLLPDGTWPGIDYADTSRTAFQHTQHLANLVQMSRAYKKKGSALAGKKELKHAISLSLDFWLKNDFICENWWNNEIGTPGDLTAVLLLMDTDLTREQTEKTSAITGRSHINAWGARQSGDRIKIAGIQAKNALFKRDAGLFEMLMKVVEGEIRFVPDNERGMQVDYSFQHRVDRVNNTLSYGLGYAEAFAEWAAGVAGTRYRFSEESLQQLIDYYLDGICKMMVYGKYPDPGATNRDIARPRSGAAFNTLILERLMSVTGYRKEELETIMKIRRNEARPALSYSKFFWQSEHYTHQRPGYFTSVRMFSSRNCNMEEPYNGEGLMNHHRGDGANYLSLTGNEYFTLSPVYDWQKIPGTTVLQKPSLPPENEIQKPGTMDYAGAVTNGKYGAAGFDFASPHDPVKARKAWFFFDDEYVCLGAGITSATNYPVVTTLNQCRLEGEVFASSGGSDRTVSQGEHSLEQTGWIFHNGVGYLFPEPAKVVLSNRAQTGSWYGINRQTHSSREEVSLDVFKLWIDHGVRANDAGYQYVVMPSSTPDKVKAAAADSPVKILANTPALQAVWHRDLNMLQAVFYTNGEVEFAGGIRITLDGPGIVMVKNEGGNIREISVADPLRKSGKMHFSINRKLDIRTDQAHSFWNEAKGVSEVSVDLPRKLFAGQSVTVNIP